MYIFNFTVEEISTHLQISLLILLARKVMKGMSYLWNRVKSYFSRKQELVERITMMVKLECGAYLKVVVVEVTVRKRLQH